MRKNYNRKIIAAFTLFTVSIFLVSFDLFPGGYVGTTKKAGGELGCICHGGSPNSSVAVFFSGPDSVAMGQTVTYTLNVAHGPAVMGGFNSASHQGDINVLTNDTMVRKQDGELTHTHPRPFVNDTVRWQFSYTAPNNPMTDTLFATGNSTNNDQTSDNDQWNWSANRLVRVYNPAIGIINLSTIAKEYSLSQNYPNPFNPVTKIRFSIAERSDVKIVIYDILGNIAATVVSGNIKQGEYETDFNGSNFASGAYFYSLIVNGEKVSTKKMLMVK